MDTSGCRLTLLGLTGGVGMGKSVAADLLQQRGIPVVDTDRLARDLVRPGQPALEEIRTEFGDGVIGAEGKLRRDELARVVFSDEARRQQLEAILHPRIRAAWLEQVRAWRVSAHHSGVVVIPLLFETGAESEFTATICVACSATSQAVRLAARGWSRDEAERRIRAQWSAERKMALADFVAWAEGGMERTAEQLDRILDCLGAADSPDSR